MVTDEKEEEGVKGESEEVLMRESESLMVTTVHAARLIMDEVDTSEELAGASGVIRVALEPMEEEEEEEEVRRLLRPVAYPNDDDDKEVAEEEEDEEEEEEKEEETSRETGLMASPPSITTSKLGCVKP